MKLPFIFAATRQTVFKRHNALFVGKRGALLLLLLLINLGTARAEDVELIVEGVDSALEDNIRAHIGSLTEGDLKQHYRLSNTLLSATRKAMAALGYFDASAEIDFSDDNRKVTLTVASGQATRWQRMDIRILGEGAQDETFQTQMAKVIPEIGQPVDQSAYEALKRVIRVNSISRGYFDGQFKVQRLEVDRDAHKANLQLEYDTGRRYKLGEVHFAESKLSDERLREFVHFEPGEPYSETLITGLNRDLLDSGYFASIGVRPQRTDDPDKPIPLDVNLEDNKPNRVGVGVGYGTDTGLRFKLNWLKPLLNSAGHSLNTTTTLTQKSKELSADYKMPATNPVTDYWLLQAGYLEEEFDRNKYWTRTLGVSRQIKLESDWWVNPFVRLRSERSVLGADDGSQTYNEDQFYLVPGISFSTVYAHGGLHPDWGYRLGFDIEFSDPALGSDTQYVRYSLQARYLFTLAEKHQLLSRGQLGLMTTPDFSEVPLSTRFFAGGDQSIRGYDYNSLGPEDADGTKTGGRYLGVVSEEYLYQVLPNWQAAVFVDHGGAFEACCTPRFTGAGIGARWLSPVGNVRIDIAHGFESDSAVRLHLFMGTVL